MFVDCVWVADCSVRCVGYIFSKYTAYRVTAPVTISPHLLARGVLLVVIVHPMVAWEAGVTALLLADRPPVHTALNSFALCCTEHCTWRVENC